MVVGILTGTLFMACVCQLNAQKKKTSVDIGVEASKGGNPAISAGVKHENNRWGANVKGTVDSKGNWGVKAGFTIRFRKRSIDWNGKHYTVVLQADPCVFSVYDINSDGAIVKSELQAIFGDSAERLFSALDITTGDGRVEEEEFYFMSRVFINGCETADRPSHYLLERL